MFCVDINKSFILKQAVNIPDAYADSRFNAEVSSTHPWLRNLLVFNKYPVNCHSLAITKDVYQYKHSQVNRMPFLYSQYHLTLLLVFLELERVS